MNYLLIIFIGILSFDTLANNCLSDRKINKLKIEDKHINYHSNLESNRRNSKITTLIVALHGTLRNGADYYKDICQSINNKNGNFLIISPTYKRVDDERDENEFFWGRKWYQKWKYGYIAQNHKSMGSFDIMDHLLEKASSSEIYPNLKEVILIGHSAGGQFVQRYASATQIRSKVSANLRFVVSNPSSYLYLHKSRVTFSSDFIEYFPIRERCPDYNEYIYGVEGELPQYLRKYTPDELKHNFAKNRVIYLMSEEDKGTDYLDRSCGAKLQGLNRIDRAYNYFQYIRKNFRTHSHEFYSIPHIGHDHLKVFQSAEAQEIFNQQNTQTNIIINKVGNSEDVVTEATSSFILMGGGGNNGESFSHLLKNARGGDVLVLSTKKKINHRYTHYLYNLALRNKIPINSITTISTKSHEASKNKLIAEKVRNAEAIFLTGGDQYRYLKYWRGTELIQEINKKIASGITLGGSSAGLAIMGEYFFSARNGTITSEEALSRPDSSIIDIGDDFIRHPILNSLITDSHYSERNREGRLLSFLSRIKNQFDKYAHGIGVDEKTSLVLENNKMFVFGDGNVYVYKNINKKSLNLGPHLKFKLKKGVIYPMINRLENNDYLISVRDGIIIQK